MVWQNQTIWGDAYTQYFWIKNKNFFISILILIPHNSPLITRTVYFLHFWHLTAQSRHISAWNSTFKNRSDVVFLSPRHTPIQSAAVWSAKLWLRGRALPRFISPPRSGCLLLAGFEAECVWRVSGSWLIWQKSEPRWSFCGGLRAAAVMNMQWQKPCSCFSVNYSFLQRLGDVV